MLSSLVLTLFLASSPNYYHSTVGEVELVSVRDTVVLRSLDGEPEGAVLRMLRNVNAERIYRNDYLIKREAIADAQWLVKMTTLHKMAQLTVFRRPGFDDIYVSDGRVNAGFDPQRPLATIETTVQALGGASVKATHPTLGWYDVQVKDPAQVLEVANRLVESGQVRFAHPDFIYKKSRMFNPNDELEGYQWHLDQISVQGAWNSEQGNAGIRIAIIDSGVDLDHPDLYGKLVEPYDALDQDYNPNPDGNDAHGTACAGLAAAQTDNGEGIAGVCPNCSIIPIRIMGEQGWGRYGADVDAFVWAVDKGAHVLSNSWGAGQATEVQPNMEEAIQYAAQNGRGGLGAIVMFAAGNEYRENYSYELASHPLVLGVGATGSNGSKEDYSNFGWELDFVAPAGSVTTDIGGYNGYSNNDYSYSFGGTSAACPVAAGVVGLVLGLNPGLSRADVFQIMNGSADKVGNVSYSDGFSPYYGNGRINAYTAIQLAAGTNPCVPSPEDCGNGTDDDCDGQVDENDSDCAPDAGLVGAPCLADNECPSNGFCITQSQYDYPGGYCTTYCSASCPSGDICVDVGGDTSICYDGCSQTSDCRDGYDCLDLEAGQTGCVPSCTVSGCAEGYVCDEYSGDCVNGNAGPAGAACLNNSDCADGNSCYDENTYDLHGGFCGDVCDSDPCGENDSCVNMGSVNLCLDDCLYNADCREGYSCYPIDENDGVCWQSCEYAGCPEGESCNEYGLCGEQQPPIVGEPPVDENSSESDPNQSNPSDNESGEIDDTQSAGNDGEASSEMGDDGVIGTGDEGMAAEGEGCSSTQSQPWMLLLLSGLWLRRRMPKMGLAPVRH
ncbi:MAG: S8 family serine peptidase [Deltaproteobacteria bacterium]|nr:S8 family serine peptidase [Deltaproteobacteria bacterium]